MSAQNPTAQQLQLPLDLKLIEQHQSLKECVAARVYAQRGGVTAVAGRLDLSPSHLSEVLGGGGERNRKFDVNELVRFMETSGDLTPLHWLNAKFLANPEAQRQHALEQLANAAQVLPGLLAAAGLQKLGRR